MLSQSSSDIAENEKQAAQPFRVKLWQSQQNISNHSRGESSNSFHSRWDMIAHFMFSNLDNAFLFFPLPRFEREKGVRWSFCWMKTASLWNWKLSSLEPLELICARLSASPGEELLFGTIVKWNVYRNNIAWRCVLMISSSSFQLFFFLVQDFSLNGLNLVEMLGFKSFSSANGEKRKFQFQFTLTTW